MRALGFVCGVYDGSFDLPRYSDAAVGGFGWILFLFRRTAVAQMVVLGCLPGGQ